MCPQAEGRVEMPYWKEACPADITRVPESGAVCGLYNREGLGYGVRCAVTVLRLDGLSLTVIGCGRHPLTKGLPIGIAAAARKGQRRSVTAHPRPCVDIRD